MTTPNPFLTAGAPELVVGLQAVQTFITTVTTGDPLTANLRVAPALQVLVGTLGLQAPALAAAELGAVGVAANAQVGNWITALQAAAAPKA